MENKRLTLQEKMVRIRARIPSLVKQAYSEEVSYDFVKIDDIFRYLTPAMNEYGVNFDIVSETATKKDERGNPMFVEFIPLYQMWIYEADLTFQWTNGENGEDQFQVTAHAIGFHQMPEKAKGSGWTYCLKYYLLNKFCIELVKLFCNTYKEKFRQDHACILFSNGVIYPLDECGRI